MSVFKKKKGPKRLSASAQAQADFAASAKLYREQQKRENADARSALAAVTAKKAAEQKAHLEAHSGKAVTLLNYTDRHMHLRSKSIPFLQVEELPVVGWAGDPRQVSLIWTPDGGVLSKFWDELAELPNPMPGVMLIVTQRVVDECRRKGRSVSDLLTVNDSILAKAESGSVPLYEDALNFSVHR